MIMSNLDKNGVNGQSSKIWKIVKLFFEFLVAAVTAWITSSFVIPFVL